MHGIQDTKYGLFAVNQNSIGFIRGVRIEMAAHTFGGTGIGVGIYVFAGGSPLALRLAYFGIRDIVIMDPYNVGW